MLNLRGVAVLLALAAGAIVAAASAQTHDHSKMGAAGPFYDSWMMPDAPHISCCHQRDCYATEARHDGLNWLAKRREDGQWLRVPATKVETGRDNPDGQNHLCAPTPSAAVGHGVYCFIPGGGT